MKENPTEVQKEILRVVQQDGTLALKQIADKVNRAESSVNSHLNILKQKKIILKTISLVDPSSVGISIIGYLYLKTFIPMEELKAALIPIHQVCACTSISGTANVLVKLATEDSRTFDRIKETIARIPTVRVIRIDVEIGEIIPDRGFWF